MAKKLADQVTGQINKELTADLNRFIKILVRQLPAYSPQYTGFFASSWKAGTQRARPQDKIADFEPWNRLKERRDAGDASAYRIAPRYPIPQFSIKTKVFIGNTTEYAAYALESPRVARFVQGTLGRMINGMFNERRKPDIRIASEKGFGGLGFLRGKTYVSYEQM